MSVSMETDGSEGGALHRIQPRTKQDSPWPQPLADGGSERRSYLIFGEACLGPNSSLRRVCRGSWKKQERGCSPCFSARTPTVVGRTSRGERGIGENYKDIKGSLTKLHQPLHCVVEKWLMRNQRHMVTVYIVLHKYTVIPNRKVLKPIKILFLNN